MFAKIVSNNPQDSVCLYNFAFIISSFVDVYRRNSPQTAKSDKQQNYSPQHPEWGRLDAFPLNQEWEEDVRSHHSCSPQDDTV